MTWPLKVELHGGHPGIVFTAPEKIFLVLLMEDNNEIRAGLRRIRWWVCPDSVDNEGLVRSQSVRVHATTNDGVVPLEFRQKRPIDSEPGKGECKWNILLPCQL